MLQLDCFVARELNVSNKHSAVKVVIKCTNSKSGFHGAWFLIMLCQVHNISGSIEVFLSLEVH